MVPAELVYWCRGPVTYCREDRMFPSSVEMTVKYPVLPMTLFEQKYFFFLVVRIGCGH